MISLPTQPEILAIEEAHRAAQARLGIAGAYLAIRDWNTLSTTAVVAASDSWLTRSLQMIRAIQRHSTRLARSYYQLARAIETGYTLGLPESSTDPNAVTMGTLRTQYLDLLLQVADLDRPAAAGEAPTTDPDELWLREQLQASSGQIAGNDEGHTVKFTDTDLDHYIQDWLDASDDTTDNDAVAVDKFEWPDEDGITLSDIRTAFADELKAAADDRAEKIRKIQESDELTAREAARKVQALHDAAGTVSAGHIDQAGINAGRETINYAASRDTRIKMVARGTGPNPCAFCAMLASRGFVYVNAKTAGSVPASTVYGDDARGDVNRYHPNCHCFIVVRWADIPDPDAPVRTKFFEDLWESEIRQKGVEARGTKNDMLNQFRRELNRLRRSGLTKTA